MLKQDASIGFILDNPRLNSKIRFDFLLIVTISGNKKGAPESAF
ncbi:hypothetical protein HMPREF0880_03708 [Yokenella regensburgei ATCC 43003]|nr:hypothetical protein HMPREF0880_03708 [Yokenella regensburgei ATCC 43003]